MISESFQTELRTRAHRIETRLKQILQFDSTADKKAIQADYGQKTWPPQLLRAMQHGVLNGGKRLRPILVIECCKLFLDGSNPDYQTILAEALEGAVALELVHCYSLIHDDLPAMDNDDWRRGQPTVHKAYDEATAILAGNALLTLAFQILSCPQNNLSAKSKAELSFRLSQAAGAQGMLGGQMLDLLAEHQQKTADEIIELELMKTGALLKFACVAGAIIAQADNKNISRLEEFGNAIGFIFQLADDLLDVSSSKTQLGKTPGKDIAAGKATLLALYGEQKARNLLDEKVAKALDVLTPYQEKADFLKQIVRFIAYRSY